VGFYFNPDNDSFAQAVRSEVYVDKTGLLDFMNRVLGTEGKCIAVSHARRFGKSQAARMLEAFYSIGADSRELFAKFEIAQKPDWDKHLNKFNVIHIDISTQVNFYKEKLVAGLVKTICQEIKDVYVVDEDRPLAAILNDVYKQSGIPFVIILDEWDCVVRNYADKPDFVHEYMQFLHDVFKSEEATVFLALGYITGILPIKKMQDESALNNFREFTMVDSKQLTPFFGFTEAEVKMLCQSYDMDFDSVKAWYDGYLINGRHMYNPNSVYQAMLDGMLDTYWKNTASFEAINTYITMNLDGLKDDVLRMLAGGRAPVNVKTFKNDLSIIRNKNEALTALIHLGYLGYDGERQEAFIPNFEVAAAYEAALEECGWTEVAKSIETANRALWAIISGQAEEFAHYVDLAHEAYTSIKNYNDENSLYSVLYMALFTARAFYNVHRELPTGKGYADMVLIPRKNVGNKPAIVLELKYDWSADTAIRQIKEKRYAGALAGYSEKVLLVGVSYDKETKQHSCVIEEM